MRLKWGIWASCCCLLACSLVSGKSADMVAAKDDKLLAMDMRPTEAPLRKSTVKPTVKPNIKPTEAPHMAATPTKAIIMNVPPKLSAHAAEKASPMPGSHAQTETMMKDSMSKSSSESTKAVNGEAMKTELGGDVKPVQVTGFITKNGNIYEIQDKNGMGLIEGRQNPVDEKMNVCNHGNIVIYSDVPCEQVTNIRVGDVVQTTLKDDKDQLEQTQNQNQQQQQQVQQEQQQQQNHNNSEQGLDDAEAVKPPRRRNGQKRKRNQNQRRQTNKNKNRNKNKNKKRQPSVVNRNQQKLQRLQAQQRRKKQQQNRRRLQNQRYSTQRRQHNNHNRIQERPQRQHQNGNSGRKGGNMNRNRHRNQRRRQQEFSHTLLIEMR